MYRCRYVMQQILQKNPSQCSREKTNKITTWVTVMRSVSLCMTLFTSWDLSAALFWIRKGVHTCLYIYTCTWPRYINHERTSVTYVLLYMLTFTVAYVFAEAKPQQKSHLILHMTLLNYDPTKNYTWLCLHMILLKQDTGQSYPSKIPAPKQSTQTKSQH